MGDKERDDPAHPTSDKRTTDLECTAMYVKQLMDAAFTNWTPTDQSLENLIDRMERRR